MASGFPKVNKTQGGNIQLDVSSWGATCIQDMEIPFEHFLSNKNVLYNENKQIWKEILVTIDLKEKHISNGWPPTPIEQFLNIFVIPETWVTCHFGDVGPTRT